MSTIHYNKVLFTSTSKMLYKKSEVHTSYTEYNKVLYNVPIIKDVVHTKVKYLDLNLVKPQRAGIVLYTQINGIIHLGFGIDNMSKDITDFGGRVNYRKNKDGNVITGAIREFMEETLYIFSAIDKKDIEECHVIHDKNNLIVFMHIDINPDDVSCVFEHKFTQASLLYNIYKENFINSAKKGKQCLYPEVSAIVWLPSYEFNYKLCLPNIFFSRVRDFLLRAGDFLHEL
jgi:hypothetical protein